MALTLQSELESKMQPRLQRLQIVEKRRKHHHLRSAVFVGSMIGAWLQRLRIVEKPKKRHLLRNAVVVGSTIGAAALVAVVVWRRRGTHSAAAAGDREDAQAGSPEQTTPDVGPDWEGPATDADAP